MDLKLNEKLKSYRIDKAYTQEEFAQLLNVSRGVISMIEANKRPVSPKVLNRLVEVSKIPKQHWLEDSNYTETDYKELSALNMLLDYMIDKDIIKDVDDVDDEIEHIIKIVKEEVAIKLKKKRE